MSKITVSMDIDIETSNGDIVMFRVKRMLRVGDNPKFYAQEADAMRQAISTELIQSIERKFGERTT